MTPFVLACLLLLVSGCCAAPRPAYRAAFEAWTGTIAVVGDTQRTIPLERLLGREQNDAERARIISAIAEERPDVLVHLGDAVAQGSSSRSWTYFDQLMEPVHRAGIPVLLVVGNHDYWGAASRAMSNLHARFPELAKSHWFAARYKDLALLWLDSNRRRISSEDWAQQSLWLKEQLERADQDPATQAVLVFCHHPPFTNSTATGDEWDVQEAFLPAFVNSRKALLMVTGHAHAYEHFEHQGKTFIVSGGGGGPRVTLLQGKDARHEDLYDGTSPRPFHYLLLRPSESGLDVEVKGFDKGETRVRTIDRFTIRYRK
jgi:Icc-related predicted phosphoesterase